MHILSPETALLESAEKDRMTVENISRSNLHERMFPIRWGSNTQPPDHQSDAHRSRLHLDKGYLFCDLLFAFLCPVVQSVVSLTSSLRVISLTVLADSLYNILIFFAEKMRVAFALHCKSYSHFFSKKCQHICVSLNVNFNESLTNDIVSFEQLGPKHQHFE